MEMIFINVYYSSKLSSHLYYPLIEQSPSFRDQLRVKNNMLIQENEEQFAIEDQILQVQVLENPSLSIDDFLHSFRMMSLRSTT